MSAAIPTVGQERREVHVKTVEKKRFGGFRLDIASAGTSRRRGAELDA
jgi:hypothetical protein